MYETSQDVKGRESNADEWYLLQNRYNPQAYLQSDSAVQLDDAR